LAALLLVILDLDVLSTAPYGTAMGHRGITPSLVFALAVGGFSPT
jgi:membrane-bound metal-dependent hydrolase YbcI (DUF457 family)